MNKVFLYAWIIAVISLSGCNEQIEYDSSLVKYPAISTPSAGSADTSKRVFLDSANLPFSTVRQQPLPSIPQQVTPAKSTVALNPKHGAPGHKCEIAVGFPLNSSPQPVQQNAPVIKSLPPPGTLTGSGKTIKLNPAHGQPGHDCAVQVGQPLKG